MPSLARKQVFSPRDICISHVFLTILIAIGSRTFRTLFLPIPTCLEVILRIINILLLRSTQHLSPWDLRRSQATSVGLFFSQLWGEAENYPVPGLENSVGWEVRVVYTYSSAELWARPRILLVPTSKNPYGRWFPRKDKLANTGED